jgi:hypothetical protein
VNECAQEYGVFAIVDAAHSAFVVLEEVEEVLEVRYRGYLFNNLLTLLDGVGHAVRPKGSVSTHDTVLNMK